MLSVFSLTVSVCKVCIQVYVLITDDTTTLRCTSNYNPHLPDFLLLLQYQLMSLIFLQTRQCRYKSKDDKSITVAHHVSESHYCPSILISILYFLILSMYMSCNVHVTAVM